MPEQTLADLLFNDQKDATKAKDRFRLSVIRMLRAELQNSSIAKKAPLDTQEELTVLTRELKRRQEALGDFEKAGRQDIVEDLKQEIQIIKSYLPKQLEEDELEKIVIETIKESGAESKREIGKVMSLLMPRVKGKADGGLVRQIVERNLQ
ncbi:MAG: GatB/YqeY domain-containing protein [Bacillota bacterium]|nr:GatB/YqeY domain-containing protein [Bacillota bacterium]